MKKKKEDPGLTTDNFIRLTTIFNTKSWEIKDSTENSLFNRFCIMLSKFTHEEQVLLLDLTDNFTRITIDNYISYLEIALEKFTIQQSEDLRKIKKIYIAPLIAPKDFGKTKSSSAVWYMLRAILPTFPGISDKQIIHTEDLEIDKAGVNKEDSLLILVDDFIGSGGTALECIDDLMSDKKIDKNKIIILAIASLEYGQDALNQVDITLYSALELKRGITDQYSSDLLPEKIELMESIEKKMKIHKNEEFGFGRSEALITLIRTPNNTFPVFWSQKKKRIAPFPR